VLGYQTGIGAYDEPQRNVGNLKGIKCSVLRKRESYPQRSKGWPTSPLYTNFCTPTMITRGASKIEKFINMAIIVYNIYVIPGLIETSTASPYISPDENGVMSIVKQRFEPHKSKLQIILYQWFRAGCLLWPGKL